MVSMSEMASLRCPSYPGPLAMRTRTSGRRTALPVRRNIAVPHENFSVLFMCGPGEANFSASATSSFVMPIWFCAPSFGHSDLKASKPGAGDPEPLYSLGFSTAYQPERIRISVLSKRNEPHRPRRLPSHPYACSQTASFAVMTTTNNTAATDSRTRLARLMELAPDGKAPTESGRIS